MTQLVMAELLVQPKVDMSFVRIQQVDRSKEREKTPKTPKEKEPKELRRAMVGSSSHLILLPRWAQGTPTLGFGRFLWMIAKHDQYIIHPNQYIITNMWKP